MSIFLEKFVGIQILSRCLASPSKKQMITPQTSRIWRGKKPIDEHGEGHPPIIYRLAKADLLIRLIPEAMPKAGESEEHPKERAETDKGKEISIVASSNTII